MEVSHLQAAILKHGGLRVDKDDPLLAVLATFVHLQEGQDRRARMSTLQPWLILIVSMILTSALGFLAGRMTSSDGEPHSSGVMLPAGSQGDAAAALARTGVAEILAKCSGRKSWKQKDGYCVPMTESGKPDGYRLPEE